MLIRTYPGGPGGSGVGQILRGGYDVRTMLSAGPDADKETAKVLQPFVAMCAFYEDGHAESSASTSISSALILAALIIPGPLYTVSRAILRKR